MPKLTMKETTIVVEAILNSSEPIRGTTVRSSPTMPPTNALMRTSSENCRQFSRKPSSMPDECGLVCKIIPLDVYWPRSCQTVRPRASFTSAHEVFHERRDGENQQRQNKQADQPHAPAHAIHTTHHCATPPDPLEHQHLVGLNGGAAELVHRAPACPVDEFCPGQPARIHAGTAQKELVSVGREPFQHAFEVVVAVWRLLTLLAAGDGNGHEEYRDLDRGIALHESIGKPEGVVAALRAVGRIVQDKQNFHFRLCLAIEAVIPPPARRS